MHAVEVVEVICIYAHKCTICIRFLNVLEEMQLLLQQPLEISNLPAPPTVRR